MFVKEIEDNLQLVLLTQNHAKELFALIDNNRQYLEKWMTWPPKTKSHEDTESFIKLCLSGLSENKELACGIEYHGRLVGVITLNEINQDLKKVIIGYWVSAECQGKGFITKSCKALIEYAFDKLGMTKIQIHVATENIPSQKVCERLGFHLEGTIKNSENLHGVIVDHNIYGLMKVDHPNTPIYSKKRLQLV